MRLPVRPRTTISALIILSCSLIADRAAKADSKAAPEDLATYASMGSAVAQNMRLKELGWTDEQFAAFVSGFRAAYSGIPYPRTEATRRLLEASERRLAAANSNSPLSSSVPSSQHFDRLEHYLTASRETFSLQKSASGLLFGVHGGMGPRPRPQDTVIVTITAKSPDNSTVLTSLSSRELRTRVSDLLPGLAEGVQMLALGGDAFLVLPPSLSFGSGPWPAGLEPGMPLIYQLRLHDIVEPAQ